MEINEYHADNISASKSKLKKIPVFYVLKNEEQAIFLISERLKRRKVAETDGNKKASRSHFHICLQIRNEDDEQVEGLINLFDLAGKEKCAERPH